MIKDIIANHFSGNPQAGCRVTYPISRFRPLELANWRTSVNTSRLLVTYRISVSASWREVFRLQITLYAENDFFHIFLSRFSLTRICVYVPMPELCERARCT